MYQKYILYRELLELTFSSCFSLLLALYAGLLVALSLTKLGQYTGLNALSLKTTKSAVESFIFFYSDFCQFLFSLPPLCKENKSQYIFTRQLYNIITYLSRVF